MNARKELPPPTGGDDLTALLRSRHVPVLPPEKPINPPTEVVNSGLPPSPPESWPAVTPATRVRRAPEMDRRSWYMPKTSADALAELVEGLFWETKQPKHAVLAALVEELVKHRAEVVTKLKSHP